MRILFDTNALIASLISPGFCHELLEHCFIHHDLFTSEFILAEVHEKLIDKFKYSKEIADEAVDLFRSKMEVVIPADLRIRVCRDPDDDNILAAAVDARCDYIVSGDKDLTVLKEFEGIKISDPRKFAKYEGSEGS